MKMESSFWLKPLTIEQIISMWETLSQTQTQTDKVLLKFRQGALSLNPTLNYATCYFTQFIHKTHIFIIMDSPCHIACTQAMLHRPVRCFHQHNLFNQAWIAESMLQASTPSHKKWIVIIAPDLTYDFRIWAITLCVLVKSTAAPNLGRAMQN